MYLAFILVTFGLWIAVLVLASCSGVRRADRVAQGALVEVDRELTRRTVLAAEIVATEPCAGLEPRLVDAVTVASADLAVATEGADIDERASADQHLSDALAVLLSASADDPEIRRDDELRDLQRRIADADGHLDDARRSYNDAVTTLNRLAVSMPYLIFSGPVESTRRTPYHRPGVDYSRSPFDDVGQREHSERHP